MTAWRRERIAELAAPGNNSLSTGPFGSSVSSKHFTSSGLPMIRGSNLSLDVGRRLIEDSLVFLDRSVRERFARSLARRGDLIFTCWGTLGQVGLIDESSRFSEYLISNKQMKLTPNGLVVDARFLYYQLCLPSMVKKIQDQGIGSSVPGFNLGQLRQLEVMVPPLAEQQAIAEVLGALDDKIAANATLIQTMDELATALYAERCTTEAPLSSLGRFVNGRNFTKDAAGRGRVVVRIAELNSGVGNSTVLNDVEAPDDNVARPGDVLFAWSGSLTVRRWTLPEALVNQHIFKVIPKPGLPTWLLYQATLALLPSFRGIAADKATTMGHIQRHHLDAAAPIPDETGMREIDSLMGSLWARAVIADQESQTLAELRDTLLPALMDGTIRVKDAIGKAEEVL